MYRTRRSPPNPDALFQKVEFARFSLERYELEVPYVNALKRKREGKLPNKIYFTLVIDRNQETFEQETKSSVSFIHIPKLFGGQLDVRSPTMSPVDSEVLKKRQRTQAPFATDILFVSCLIDFKIKLRSIFICRFKTRLWRILVAKIYSNQLSAKIHHFRTVKPPPK